MGELKKKGAGLTAREELAKKLRDLASALEEGRFAFEGETWPLERGPLEYKWEIKIKAKKLKFSLTLELKEFEKEKNKNFRPKTSSKQIKKTMGAYWKSILRRLKLGELPFLEDIEGLLETFNAYEPFVEKTWQEDWFTCLERVKTLYEVVKGGDISRAQALSAEILALEKDCHRKYK